MMKQVVKVIWQQGWIATAHGRFSHVHQVAPMCTSSNTCVFGQTWIHIPKSYPQVQLFFAQLMADSPHTLQWAAPFLSKMPLPMGDLDPHLVPVPTQVHIPNDISIGSAIFARAHDRDRPTDHPTPSPTLGRIAVRSTVMPPKKHPLVVSEITSTVGGAGLINWILAGDENRAYTIDTRQPHHCVLPTSGM